MLRIYNPYGIAAISCLAAMMFGFDISSMSSFISQPPYRSYFDEPDTLTQGGITSSMSGGSFLGCLVTGQISDRYGRKPCIQICAAFWIVGCAIQCASNGQAALIAGRVIAGIGVGFGSSTVPPYLSEMAERNIRGRLVSMFQFFVTIGILIMFLVGYGCSFIDSNASFRVAWGVSITPGALLAGLSVFLCESPRWLAEKDRWEECIETVANIQAKGDANHEKVLIEMEEIKEAVRVAREGKSVSYFEMFNKKSILRTFIGITAQIWQQMVGMNVAMYYIVYLFQMANMTGMGGDLVPSIIQYVLNVVMTIPALIWVDTWGRRYTLMVGAIFMAIFHFAIAGLLATYGEYVPEGLEGSPDIKLSIPTKYSHASKGVIACSYLFVVSYAMTWGPSIWLYCSEIFPLRQRATANGLCASFNWIFNFALGLFTPVAFAQITWRTYIMFGVFCVAAFIEVAFLFPETKGRSLEEITVIFDERVPAWRSSKYVTYHPNIDDVKAVNGGRRPSFTDKAHTSDEDYKEEVA